MNPYRIESLHLTKVGPFEELELTLPVSPSNGEAEVHILTGENGTGKTSVLEAISVMFFDYYQTKAYHKSQRVKLNESGVSIAFSSGHSLTLEAKLNEQVYASFANILGIEVKKAIMLFTKNAQLASPPQFAAFAYSGYRRSEGSNVDSIKDIEISPIADATDLIRSIDPRSFLQWLVNTQARALMALGKNKPKEAEQHRQNLSIVEQAITEVTGLRTFFELEDNPFQAKINVDGQSLNFDQIPDGLKSIVSWLGDLLMRMDRIQWADDVPVLERPFLLLLDEIDVHLHPAWQRKILPVVQKLFPNAQVIVSTHSPFVVGSVDGAWVHRFVKKEGFSVLAGPPTLSEDALSYEYILEEIFGIKERFGVEVEADLAEFQRLKKQALTNDETFDEGRFQELIQSLGSQSIELESMIGMELKQLQRLTQRSFV